MAPKYELSYFIVSARAGIARMLFKVAGVEFTDTIVDFGGEWGKIKNDVTRFPLKRLPVLNVDGKILCESQAIDEFLAHELGFYGDCNWDRGQIAMVTSVVKDLRKLWIETCFTDPKKKEELRTKLFNTTAPQSFDFLQDLLKKNNGGQGYFVGSKVSLADVAFVDAALTLMHTDKGCLDKHPLLKGLLDRVVALPAVADHVKSRVYPPGA